MLRPTALLAALLVTLVGAPTHTAHAQSALTSQSDLRAPAGQWQTIGGGPDRSRATHTEVPRQAPAQQVFVVETGDTLVGEPLFNTEVLVLETRVARGEHRITVYDLETGEAVADRDFEVRDGCFPHLKGDVLVLRSAIDQLNAFELSTKGLRRLATYSADSGFVGAPFVVGDDVFVGEGASILRLDGRYLREREAARYPSREYGSVVSALYIDSGPYADQGRLSIGFLTSNDHGASGRPMAAAFDPLRSEEPVVTSRYQDRLRIAFRDSWPNLQQIVVSPFQGGLMFWSEDGIDEIEGNLISGIGYDGDGDPIEGAFVTRYPVAARDSSVIGHVDAGDEGQGVFLVEHSRKSFGRRTATEIGICGPGLHEHLLPLFRGATWGRDVVLLAGRAWHPETGRVLWHVPALERAALLPAEQGVVAVFDDGRVERWRVRPFESEATAKGATRSATDEQDVEPFDGVLVRSDGEVDPGTYAIVGGNVVEIRGTKERDVAAADVWFLGAEDGTVHRLGAARAVGPGIDAVVGALEAREFSRYANAAERSNDPDRITRAIARGQRIGEDVDDLVEELAQLRAKPESVSSKQAERFDEYESQFSKTRFDTWVRALASVRPDEATFDAVHQAMLVAMLDRSVGLEDVRRDVQALLPEGIDLPLRADLRDWLAFARSTSAHTIRVVEPPPEDQATMTWEERRLGMATAWGGDDVVGFESENLFVISSLDQPGAIATCVAVGEHVCSLLEGLFAGGEHARSAEHRMVVYLYESKSQYLKQSSGGDQRVATGLSWTAGHYDPQTGVVRLFLPAGEGDWESAQQTFRHELAHQWMSERCPGISDEQSKQLRTDQDGFWIVEGFACFVQDFRVDERLGVTGELDSRSNLLDVVANASADVLLPWDMLTELKQARRMGLLMIEPAAIALTWSLGRIMPVDGMGLFYAQSNALASFLYHGENGKYRDAFIEYTLAFYRGTEGMDFEKHFGLSPSEAGRLAVEHARTVVGRD
ncbi:hypothetical protein Pla163_25330 [Planctomycetes bacterium Pla163]|uniref:DUF1570 domain-containing protein n=1 Tax=Rohdeia mirabilis TaxID=2528008 RepID=A0A518D1Q4_9BACT|nr:hypothetical protein Pla163_25330 [Planctomycetes bacterium Pla163]